MSLDTVESGSGGDVQVGFVVRPRLVAVGATSEGAALHVDPTAGIQGEGGRTGAPVEPACPGLLQDAEAVERDVAVVAVGGQVELQCGRAESEGEGRGFRVAAEHQ